MINYSKTNLAFFWLSIGLFFVLFPIKAQNDILKDSCQFIDIEGYKYHVKLGGREYLKDSIPVVILEMGAGSTMKTWDPIFNELTKIAPVIAYERSGIGESEWNNIIPTPINVTQQLRKILKKLNLPPPYVLAGHSWGGVIIRAYAGYYRNEVKALVYIDPMDYEMTVEDEKDIYNELGVEPEKALKFIQDVTQFFTGGRDIPPGIAAEYEAIELFMETDYEKRGLGKEPNLPMVVFIGTKTLPEPSVPSHFEKPWDHKDWVYTATKQRIESLSKWPYNYSDQGYLFLSPEATHYFHFGESKMVIEMIERFVNKK
jgi:pimeloyl-ACP methyl ester carboxylesterase